MTPEIILGAILSLQPTLNARTAKIHAQTIYQTSSDVDDTAALIVTDHRESRFGLGCIRGIGGNGSFGLGFGYQKWACKSLPIQASWALQALYDKGWASSERQGFKGYLGARHDDWPEIGVRLSLWQLTRERLKCGCSI